MFKWWREDGGDFLLCVALLLLAMWFASWRTEPRGDVLPGPSGSTKLGWVPFEQKRYYPLWEQPR